MYLHTLNKILYIGSYVNFDYVHSIPKKGLIQARMLISI